ncbi:Mucin-associated surface protein (MASP) [Trypanosoma cruzi]|uniref:Mucin-associated surface protein (MASP), putative n=2 Tax=Trypanosoma cruzi TaxID=5693 RepID=Q4CUN5_TRYCC|nr:mucin-associated surface protein (MASP), putative [Trypanosoma cruzi]EAN83985.1 mucin-associated surface protein (MASP), putative [Trypanosoma cruzi]PWV20752.1 Mucin-associated surface protein (MASP) [Trypanosoma cruzi]PWV20755.1 Mucin-associated surface protein (MASP) [Trypanosoma cruzi]RNC40130.1 mucin-associated surface protein (MASP) [Trypanosoma cruzi]|eukprot:XP_805836.1 mucin-associated surface protein (MASP) [Trypanosoma cruzi strain CL Brener]
MAMMMTGRALLVCALCVLWCGAGGGGRAEAAPPAPSGSTPEKSTKKDNATVVDAEGGVQNDKQAAPQAPALTAPGLQGEEAEAPARPSQQPGGASKAANTTTDNTDHNTDDEKREEEQQEEEDEEEDEEGEEEEQDEEDGTKEEETKKEKVVASTTGEMSAVSREQPSLSSGTARASNITDSNSTQTTGNDVSAADAAGTAEGKQNENKDANPKETPATVAAMKTTTAATGDSDSSTAVSHTTSPLLLLLVVACAAAVAA